MIPRTRTGPGSPRHRSPAVLVWLLLVVAGWIPPRAMGQGRDASLLIRVVTDSQPLPGVQIHIHGSGFQGTTDEQGQMRITGLHPRFVTVEARLLGYATLQLSADLEAGQERFLTFPLTVRPLPLAEIRVEGRARRPVGARAGFLERRKRGIGSFVTREEIERARPRRFSDLLRMVPGMRMTCDPLSEERCGAAMESSNPVFAPDLPIRHLSRDRSCPIQYFVDGVFQPQTDVNLIRPDDVEAVEVYHRASQAPVRYARGADARCGVILIWMRSTLR